MIDNSRKCHCTVIDVRRTLMQMIYDYLGYGDVSKNTVQRYYACPIWGPQSQDCCSMYLRNMVYESHMEFYFMDHHMHGCNRRTIPHRETMFVWKKERNDATLMTIQGLKEVIAFYALPY